MQGEPIELRIHPAAMSATRLGRRPGLIGQASCRALAHAVGSCWSGYALPARSLLVADLDGWAGCAGVGAADEPAAGRWWRPPQVQRPPGGGPAARKAALAAT